jgi:hypothetical protein
MVVDAASWCGTVRLVWDNYDGSLRKCDGEVPLMEDLVEVGQYDSVIAADLAKASLESSGIQAILINKGIAQIYPGATYAFGGIRLMVRAEDAQAATEILSLKDEPN